LWGNATESRAGAPKRSPSAVRPVDPLNVDAESAVSASQKSKAVLAASGRVPREAAALAAGTTPSADQPTVNDTDVLDAERARRSVRAERLTREVLQTIEAARKNGTQDAGSALGLLKRSLTTVISSSDIDPMPVNGCAPDSRRASIRC